MTVSRPLRPPSTDLRVEVDGQPPAEVYRSLAGRDASNDAVRGAVQASPVGTYYARRWRRLGDVSLTAGDGA